MVVALVLALALVGTLVALALALGVFDPADENGPIAGASPTSAVLVPTPSPATASAGASAAPSAGPTTAPTATSAAVPTPGGTHVVQSGETLFAIGVLYGVPYQQIMEANELDSEIIFVGQELFIPVPATPGPGAAVHYVQPGESVFSIAELYGITPTELADANSLEDWNRIFVGQELVIPGVTPSASPG